MHRRAATRSSFSSQVRRSWVSAVSRITQNIDVDEADAIIRRVAEKKLASSVVALSSAAVLAIYGAGYARTREAADRFAQRAAERRPHIPASRDDRAAATADGARGANISGTPVAAAESPANPEG